MLDNPWPLYIVVPWTVVIVSAACGYLYLRFKKDRTTIYGDMTLESEGSAEIGKDEKALKENLAKKEEKVEKKAEKVEKKEEKVKNKKQKVK